MSAQGRETRVCGNRELPRKADRGQVGKRRFPATMRICADFRLPDGGPYEGTCMERTPNHLRCRREKVFQNHETRVPLDREAKVRIMHLARALKHRIEKGKYYQTLDSAADDSPAAQIRMPSQGQPPPPRRTWGFLTGQPSAAPLKPLDYGGPHLPVRAVTVLAQSISTRFSI